MNHASPEDLAAKNTELENLLALKDRELQLEAALENVRTRSMAMQKSEELKEIIKVVFEQLVNLNILIEHAGFIIDYNTNADMHIWLADKQMIPSRITVPYFDSPHWNSFIEAKQKGKAFFANLLNFEAKNKFYTELFELIPEVSKESRQYYLSCPGLAISTVLLDNVGLYIENFSAIPYTAQENSILMRFGKVFQQTYTRFLDLQTAEAQGREARIQLALERVRAKTMAMQRSDELNEVAALLFQQVSELGIKVWTTGFNVWSDDGNFYTDYVTTSQGNVVKAYTIDARSFSVFSEVADTRKSGDEFFVQYLEGELLKETYKRLTSFGGEGQYDKMLEDGFQFPSSQYVYFVFGSKVSLMFITYHAVPEAHDIFLRFGKVFEQTYTRFLDLQKAEAQARESQIQLALERVRARTMAMYSSDELADASHLLERQVAALGIKTWGCAFHIFREHDSIEWFANQNGVTANFGIAREGAWLQYYDGCKNGELLQVVEYAGEACVAHYEHMLTMPVVGDSLRKLKESGGSFPTFQIEHIAAFKYGYLLFVTFEAVPEAHDVFKRFAKVFEQTYTRFLDLQKAELQARESKIEAALEKIRSRSLSMHNSSELKHVVAILFEKLKELNLEFDGGAAIHLFSEDSKDVVIWVATQDLAEPICVNLPYEASALINNPIRADVNRAKETGEHIFNKRYSFEEKNTYFNYVFRHNNLSVIPQIQRDLLLQSESYTASFIAEKNSLLGANSWTGQLFSESDFDVLKRIARVFEQAYIRFLDLQKAEAQALEARKRASVDRVRAEIASMRTTDDLERITPLIWNELTTLGVPFKRCGVFILDDPAQKVQTFLYTEGKTIASFTSNFASSRLVTEALPYWRKKEIYKTHWDEAAFLEQAKTLLEQGAITDRDNYLTDQRPTDLHLHLLPFLQGMLYVGNTAALTDEHLNLVQALADAFSTAYARYEDFNKLETAKKQVDSTLIELQLAQKQLIQSEKMASLGELTAGIAHEIQNPLNFVNNFSEVNRELLTELKEEIEKGNLEEVKALAVDIIANEEKITHHGKRADSIVKGMLQHSRSTSNTKEATDINTLADEYLRLAYHGLKAKDRSFNATMKTTFDETIGTINIITQDIGRVILNLVTNAFYAVNEKKTQQTDKSIDFEPIVSLTTRRNDHIIEISVADNGNGIPQKVIDKIFQPFFTTKPTGQGTGLGLSLAYDIVKSHGGRLKAETTEGEGSEFIIELPLS